MEFLIFFILVVGIPIILMFLGWVHSKGRDHRE